MDNIQVMTLTYDQLFEKVYGKGGMPIDETVFDRIRYFNYDDFSWMQRDLDGQYTILEIDDKIIGVAKVAYYQNSASHSKQYSISYFSIDLQYRNRGYTRIMANELFRNAKEKGLDINSSQYTVLGKKKLQHVLKEMADNFGVNFEDKNDYLHDAEHMYDHNLVHQDELERFEKLMSENNKMVVYHPKHLSSKKQQEPVITEKKRVGVLGKLDEILNRNKISFA